MTSLFDMMTSAQNGSAMAEMARRFGLSQAQAMETMAALMPAFSAGLKRNVTTPQDLTSFLQALAFGGHGRFFDDVTAAMAPAGVREGEGILSHLFGSKEISRAVARQAAATVGVGEAVLKEMLPVVAAMIMGGLARQTAANTGQHGGAAPDFYGHMMEQFAKAQAAAVSAVGTWPAASAENPFAAFMEQWSAGQGTPRPAPERPDATPDAFSEMMQRMMPRAPESVRPDEEPSDRKPSGENPYAALFGQMFESGARIQQDYQRQMEALFDGLQGSAKHGS